MPHAVRTPALVRANDPLDIRGGTLLALFPGRQGHGYATEAAAAMVSYAFDVLRLRRVVATTEHANTSTRSVNVMRRLGMRLERNPQDEPHWFQTVGILDPPA